LSTLLGQRQAVAGSTPKEPMPVKGHDSGSAVKKSSTGLGIGNVLPTLSISSRTPESEATNDLAKDNKIGTGMSLNLSHIVYKLRKHSDDFS
jgi:hypothetical protein